MKIYIINPIIDKRWDLFVNRHDSATIFHTSAWARVLQERYQSPPKYWVMENEKGDIVALAPFFKINNFIIGSRLLCLPNSEYCFPLAIPSADIMSLMKVVNKEVHKKEVSFLEIRGWESPILAEHMGLKEYYYFLNHRLELDPDPEMLKQSFIGKKHKHLRNRINRTYRSSINIHEVQDETDLKKFYILYVKHRRRLHLLPEPYDYFKAIFDYLIIPGFGFVHLAEIGGQIIAGDINLSFNDTMLVKFGVYDDKFLQYKAQDLLTWNAIKRACIEGRRYYDFGRTFPENHGLVNYKRRWGCEEIKQPYYYYPNKPGVGPVSRKGLLYNSYIFANRLLPGIVAEKMGKILSKRIG